MWILVPQRQQKSRENLEDPLQHLKSPPSATSGQPTCAGHMGNGINWDQDLVPPESDRVINGVFGLIEGQLRQQTAFQG
ncbi:hypothetical protein GT037_010674 [Alternaria burnsii]|uniref:Uncharacterized protein n=1 Tax=Alternaria burnsii TaxID=1187904 RepID=A0A8H7AVL4_9PLEO|nr:uncharacterized protein GT037_010674 [Alternaria burnsii]KAF7671349.1 hypothetical protein GT037_010674 [Alternaria burnsii]